VTAWRRAVRRLICAERAFADRGGPARRWRYHVRVYPVARTVAEQVNLRDERVVIERRPSGTYSPTDKDLAPREVDVVERHEEPVVEKGGPSKRRGVVSHD
jgi:Domain of unknown function (DUF2382)